MRVASGAWRLRAMAGGWVRRGTDQGGGQVGAGEAATRGGEVEAGGATAEVTRFFEHGRADGRRRVRLGLRVPLRWRDDLRVVRVSETRTGRSPSLQCLTKIVRLAPAELCVRQRPNPTRLHEHDIVRVLHLAFDDEKRNSVLRFLRRFDAAKFQPAQIHGQANRGISTREFRQDAHDRLARAQKTHDGNKRAHNRDRNGAG